MNFEEFNSLVGKPDSPIGTSFEGRLQSAADYAQQFSGCQKVPVGAVLMNWSGLFISAGANRTLPNLCGTPRGCKRKEAYGNDDKTHRGSADCRAIHSEINAIADAAASGKATYGAAIFVTRYPCEGCARAIALAGIRNVIYGGLQKTSEETDQIFEEYGVIVTHIEKEFVANDKTN